MYFRMIMIFYLLPWITLGGFFWSEEIMDLMCCECVIKTTLFLRKIILWVLFFKDRPATNMVAYYSLYYYWLYSNSSWTKSLSIKLIRIACTIILLSLKRCLFQVLLLVNRFWTDAEVHKPQDRPNTCQAVRHGQSSLAHSEFLHS